ncbi:MAG: glycosyltransferase family 39 protein [Bacteroidota bacterium]
MKSSAFKTLALLLIALAILPILYFPISIDHAIYLRGGQTILEGNKLFADYLDIKPPFVEYLFAFKILLSGSSEISLRIFDLIWQSVTIAFLMYTVFKRMGDPLAAWSCGFIYALLYSTLGFSQSMQCETLAASGFVLLLYLHSVEDTSRLSLILRGICIGWVMGFKYTFGIILPVIFFYDLLKGDSFKTLFKNYSIIIASSFFMLALMLSPLFDAETRGGYAQILQYLSVYATFPPMDANGIRYILKATSGFYSDRFSLFFIVLTIAGCAQIFKNGKEYQSTQKKSLLILCCFMVMGLLFSAFVERKVNPYHFSRTYIPLSILAGVGAAGFLRATRYYYREVFKRKYPGLLRYFIVIPAVIFILLFSPFPRWIKLLGLPVDYYTNTAAYDKNFDGTDNAVARTQHKAVAAYILTYKQPLERTFVMSVATSVIYYLMNERPISKFVNPQFYFSYGCLEAWRMDARRELEKITWLVVQSNDHQPFLNGHYRSSWESLQQDSLLYPYVRDSFKSVDTIGNFYIFKRTFLKP